METWNLPAELTCLIAHWSTTLHARVRGRWAVLLVGILFARGRRTVTSWLRTAGVTVAFPLFYYFLAVLGRESDWMASALFRLIRPRLQQDVPWLFAIDDTPTKRYGPCVEGAGRHRNPTPGPAGSAWFYGHVWVTLAWVLEHPRWGRLALPLLARLYVREKDLEKLDPEDWPFRTKLELAGDLICWLRQRLGQTEQPVWLCADGFYAKREVMDRCRAQNVVLFSRLRRDAAIFSVPVPERRRGQPRKYGRDRLSLAKRAGHRQGWQTAEVLQYGQVRNKIFKTFLATWVPARGVIRVVLVRETTGVQFFFCTDPEVPATTILEVMAARSSIEQTFCDLKEIQGAGQQQVRNVQANVGAFHCCCWAFVIVEWWAWNRDHQEICDRSASVWDDPQRRPSHQDRRRALQRESLREELMHWTIQGADQQKIRNRLLHWIRLWT